MQYISFYERFYELLIREPYIKNSIAVALIWVVGDIIKNDGRDWMHFEMPIRHFILVKWVYISKAFKNHQILSSACETGKNLYNGCP